MNNCIITCDSKKLTKPSIAQNMYIGSFFKTQLQWAKKHFNRNNIFILSAKYGLLKLDDLIEPYDLKMGDKNSVNLQTISKQIKKYKINGKIYSTAGKEYRKILDKVFINIEYPFRHLKGMGYMIKAMKDA